MTVRPPDDPSDRSAAPRTITPDSGSVVAAAGKFPFPLAPDALAALVRSALDEDRAFEDLTTIATVPAGRHARASLVARERGVVCGALLAAEAFRLLDDRVAIRVDHEDGAPVEPGDSVLFLTGHARALLSAERVALNYVQRLSGIASLTASYVHAVEGTDAKILDTRKTMPGWRTLAKYAVRCGGGTNHRMDLASGVLIKDNHLAALDGDIEDAIRRARALAPPDVRVEVECDRVEQVVRAAAAGADIILLDNMPPAVMAECVRLVQRRAILEASGGVNLSSVRAIADTGVDWISVGALTHSAGSLDFGVDFE